jgi:hypothetical protein
MAEFDNNLLPRAPAAPRCKWQLVACEVADCKARRLHSTDSFQYSFSNDTALSPYFEESRSAAADRVAGVVLLCPVWLEAAEVQHCMALSVVKIATSGLAAHVITVNLTVTRK